VNLVIVLGNERLHADLSRLTAGSNSAPDILKFPKSGGCMERDASMRQQMATKKIREYFHGTPTDILTPYSSSKPFDEFVIQKIGDSAVAPSSALPIGAGRVLDALQMPVIDPTLEGSLCMHAILGISNTTEEATGEEGISGETLIGTSVCGFAYM